MNTASAPAVQNPALESAVSLLNACETPTRTIERFVKVFGSTDPDKGAETVSSLDSLQRILTLAVVFRNQNVFSEVITDAHINSLKARMRSLLGA